MFIWSQDGDYVVNLSNGAIVIEEKFIPSLHDNFFFVIFYPTGEDNYYALGSYGSKDECRSLINIILALSSTKKDFDYIIMPKEYHSNYDNLVVGFDGKEEYLFHFLNDDFINLLGKSW